MSKYENNEGFTKQELSQDITLERFNEYHYSVGEDFIDQNESVAGNGKVYGGWLLARYPEKKDTILKVLNDDYGPSVQEFFHEVFEHGESEDCEGTAKAFYTDLAEFINMTVITKERVNTILLREARHA